MLTLTNATFIRDIALQVLHNNDLVPGSSIARRLRHVVEHWSELNIPAADVLSGIFLPLNELIRVRDCSKQWSDKAKATPPPPWLCHDGSSTYEQIEAYSRIAQQVMASPPLLRRPPTFCETGFNAGHTASIFLLLGYHVHSFDVAMNRYTPACAALLSRVWPDRFTLHVGDSRQTLPQWTPAAKCDVISVDGLHTQAAVRSDVLAFTLVARHGATLLVDDTSPNYLQLMTPLHALHNEKVISAPQCTDLGNVQTNRGMRPKHFCHSTLMRGASSSSSAGAVATAPTAAS